VGALALAGRQSMGEHNNQPKNWLRLLGGALERRCGWVGMCGEDGCLSSGYLNGATKNIAMGGLLALDGRL